MFPPAIWPAVLRTAGHVWYNTRAIEPDQPFSLALCTVETLLCKLLPSRPLGGPKVLRLTEVSDPVPGPEQLLVRVRATALNRADTLQRRGHYPPPPGESDILGLELAGEVLTIGAATQGFAPGDRVFGLAGGGRYAAASARLLTPRCRWPTLLRPTAIWKTIGIPVKSCWWSSNAAADATEGKRRASLLYGHTRARRRPPGRVQRHKRRRPYLSQRCAALSGARQRGRLRRRSLAHVTPHE